MDDNDIFVTGANGMLGRAVVKAIGDTQFYRPIAYLNDVTNMEQVERLLTGAKIINCAGIVRGRDDISAKRMGVVNSFAPHVLAGVAKRLIHVSTDCVFDGSKGPYVETDEPTPADNYAMSKLSGEVGYGPHLTVRTSFVGFGERGLLRWLMDRGKGDKISGYHNWLWNGLYVGTLAHQLVRLLDDPMTGVVHIEGPEINKDLLLSILAEAVRPDLKIITTESIRNKNMILKSERLIWGDAPDTTFSWKTMIDELKADYEVEQANTMLASGGDPEETPGIQS